MEKQLLYMAAPSEWAAFRAIRVSRYFFSPNRFQLAIPIHSGLRRRPASVFAT